MAKRKKGNLNLHISIIVAVTFFLIGFLLYKNSRVHISDINAVKPTGTFSPTDGYQDNSPRIKTAIRQSDSQPIEVKTITTDSEEILSIDNKDITSIQQPSARQYGDIYTYDGSDFVLVTVVGGTVSDIVIADLAGNLITNSVVEKNPALEDWTVKYSEKIPEKNQVIITLSKVTGEQRNAILELSTGIVSLQ